MRFPVSESELLLLKSGLAEAIKKKIKDNILNYNKFLFYLWELALGLFAFLLKKLNLLF